MLQFAEQFPDKKIVSPLATQLSWSHFIELLEMDKDGIMVAEYWTDLPPKKELEEKVHTLLIEARERLESRKLLSVTPRHSL
ncbi:hypothetical protein AGMMS49940_18920 [Spirochaetia bacterium]|nr:hypothetical protein AGMMS49940_18920 [Spirochaetia bacterium]